MYSILIWLTVVEPSVPGPGEGVKGKFIWMLPFVYVIVDRSGAAG